MDLNIAEGEEEPKITAEVSALLENGWLLDDDRSGLRKTYYFKTYTKVLDMHHTIGVRSKAKNHHAEMISKSGSLAVHWTTHVPRGLSAKDAFMARYCDEIAVIIGCVEVGERLRCDGKGSV